MSWFFRLLIGFYKIRFYSENRERILNFALQKNLPIWGISREEDCIAFFVSPFYLSYFEGFFSTLSSSEKVEKAAGGLLRLWQLFRKRGGFFFGLFLFVFVQYLSTLFIWGVVIYGNDRIPTEVMREDLSNLGLSPGVRLSQRELDEIALRYQIADERFLYVNLNRVGTKVYAEVRERENFEEKKEAEKHSNLVAERFGTVVRYEVLDGQIEVKVGQKVTEGDLLISGVRENKNGVFSAVQARGRVFAQTERLIEITIPFMQNEKVFTGKEWSKKSYEILGICVSFPQKTPSENATFETIEMEDEISLFGYDLPVRKKEKIFLETVEKKAVLELDRAEKLAYDKYDEIIRETFAIEDEILEEKMSFSSDEFGVTLLVTVIAVEDICKEIPFVYQSAS
ncbi:MAG: sporulation protein YqfD [Clostridia bacterium]|nr:sporulation protein YqfD [Clostridia bacterium]